MVECLMQLHPYWSSIVVTKAAFLPQSVLTVVGYGYDTSLIPQILRLAFMQCISQVARNNYKEVMVMSSHLIFLKNIFTILNVHGPSLCWKENL